jgi:hypothetical protein
MKEEIRAHDQGPALLIAQLASDHSPFNSLPAIAKWAASLGYKGLQLPSPDTRFLDLRRCAESQTYRGSKPRSSAKALRRGRTRSWVPFGKAGFDGGEAFLKLDRLNRPRKRRQHTRQRCGLPRENLTFGRGIQDRASDGGYIADLVERREANG